MAFGFLKKAIKKISGRKRETINYRGRKGTKNSPFENYSARVSEAEKMGDVEIAYGDSESGYKRMRKVEGTGYLERIAEVEAKDGRMVSVDESGIVRRLRSSEHVPIGFFPGTGPLSYEVKETLEENGQRYNVYDTNQRDRFGHQISYVVKEENASRAAIEDRSDRLVAYQNKLVDKGGQARDMNEIIGRGYLERKLKELEKISKKLETVTINGEEFYAQNLKNGRIRTFKKSVVDDSLKKTKYTLDNNDEDSDWANKFTERQFRNAFSKSTSQEEPDREVVEAGAA